MKRIVSIVIITALMLVVAVAECVVSTRFYTEMHAELVKIDKFLVNENPSADGEIVRAKTDALIVKWERAQKIAMAFSNHSIIRALDEKLVSIKAWVDNEKYDNAHEFCVSAIELSGDLIDETHLTLANLL